MSSNPPASIETTTPSNEIPRSALTVSFFSGFQRNGFIRECYADVCLLSPRRKNDFFVFLCDLCVESASYPTHFRALRNMRSHGESSPMPSECQDICTLRKTRSGCGIIIVKRPSVVVTPVMPSGEPFGLYG